VLFGKAVFINTLKLIKVIFDQSEKRWGFGIAGR